MSKNNSKNCKRTNDCKNANRAEKRDKTYGEGCEVGNPMSRNADENKKKDNNNF